MLELDETHKHATVVTPLPQPGRAAQSTPGRGAGRLILLDQPAHRPLWRSSPRASPTAGTMMAMGRA